MTPLSDADRSEVVALLRAHFDSGRLTLDELSHRLLQVPQLRTTDDLVPLFRGLGAPQPAALSRVTERAEPGEWKTYPQGPGAEPQVHVPIPLPPGQVPARRREAGLPASGQEWLGAARRMIWPVAVVLWLATGQFWPILVAIVFTAVVRKQYVRRPPDRD